jgi:hypothetical protein
MRHTRPFGYNTRNKKGDEFSFMVVGKGAKLHTFY